MTDTQRVRACRTDILTTDFETYYDRQYSLSKMPTEEYVRDPQFEVIGVSVKRNEEPAQWFSGTKAQTARWLGQWDWGNSLAVAHNAPFDMAILNWHFHIKPKRIADTLAMARAVDGPDGGNSLAKLAERHGLGVKGTEVINALGKRRLDFTPEELARYGDYCVNDTELTYKLFRKLVTHFTASELRLVDLTTRMFTEPALHLDKGALVTHLADVQRKKADLLGKAMVNKDDLMSNPKFADLLRALGVEPPMKISPLTGKETYAFAKSDAEFKELLDHENMLVQALVAARMGTKSTLEETRTERFIGIADRGLLPVPLRYYGAHTGRWSAEGGVNLQNLPRKSPLKKAIKAPKGYVIINCDSSQIECVSGDTLILTEQRGYVRITDISKTDRLWDGVEWVSHDGVVYKGLRRVISYGGITGTPDHIVYTAGGGRLHLAEAAARGATLAVGERDGQTIRFVGGVTETHPVGAETESLGQVPPLRPRVSSGFSGHEERQVEGVQGGSAHQPLLCQYTKGGSACASAAVQPDTGSDIPHKQEQSLRFVQEPGDTESILFLRGVRPVHMGLTPPPRLQRVGDRPDRQRRTLRAGQPATGDSGTERTEPPLQRNDYVSGGSDERNKVVACGPAVVPPGYGQEAPSQRADGGGDCIPVFDILNAGPRNRFTANGVIISNCRVLAWMAGQEDLVETFRKNNEEMLAGVPKAEFQHDPYKLMASQIYGVPLYAVTPEQRQVGKVVLLGAGYGLGWRKFMDYARQQGVIVDDAFAKRTIEVYRDTFPYIPVVWEAGDTALQAIMADQSSPLGGPGVLSVEGQEGIRLPNGFYISYANLRRERDSDTGRVRTVYDAKRGKAVFSKPIWGGGVTENWCQALARIVVGEQMLMIARRYKVVMTVHDSAVAVAEREEVDEAQAFIEACMRTRPKWAGDLPLNCESEVGASYGG